MNIRSSPFLLSAGTAFFKQVLLCSTYITLIVCGFLAISCLNSNPFYRSRDQHAKQRQNLQTVKQMITTCATEVPYDIGKVREILKANYVPGNDDNIDYEIKDVYSEKALLILSINDGIIIYSVGPDLRDDRMAVAYDPTNGIMSTGDIGVEIRKDALMGAKPIELQNELQGRLNH